MPKKSRKTEFSSSYFSFVGSACTPDGITHLYFQLKLGLFLDSYFWKFFWKFLAIFFLHFSAIKLWKTQLYQSVALCLTSDITTLCISRIWHPLGEKWTEHHLLGFSSYKVNAHSPIS